jgi:hypothetical protein
MPTSPAHALIDATYECFVATLPPAQAAVARGLPCRLGLSPLADVPWSLVFNNVAVLGFPALLFGETSREVDREVIACALRAHMFAMIAAFGEDRITDGQIVPDAELQAVLASLAAERDRALAELVERGAVISLDYRDARRETEDASAEEQATFAKQIQTVIERYRGISRGKQALAFPASLAAASAAGFGPEEIEHVRELLLGCTLGLQYRDDVVDWLDDRHCGGAWAVCLLDDPAGTEQLSDEAVARQLDEQRVLVEMLKMSRDEFARAARAALSLGARSLSRWAAQLAAVTGELTEREVTEPGHALAWERARVARRTAAQAVAQVA